MYNIPFRYQMKLASMSATALGKLQFVWKNCRKMTDRTQQRYYDIVKILDYYGLEKPKLKISLEMEELK